MRHNLLRLTFACVLILPIVVVGQESAIRQLVARIELHSIETLTISDEQFLRGDSAGKPVIVSAEFRIPRGSSRLPAVILIHGSGGIGANIDVWSREFNSMGISAFIVDGFTGRGLTTVSADQRLLGRLNLMLDGFRALGILARHSQVDPERIMLMGFSRGGQATLYASLRRFHQNYDTAAAEAATRSVKEVSRRTVQDQLTNRWADQQQLAAS